MVDFEKENPFGMAHGLRPFTINSKARKIRYIQIVFFTFAPPASPSTLYCKIWLWRSLPETLTTEFQL